MNKNIGIGLGVVALLVIAGVAYASMNSKNDSNVASDKMEKEAMMAKDESKMTEAELMEKEKMEKEAMEKKASEGDAMMKKDEGSMEKKDEAAAMSVKGSYIAYDSSKLVNAEKGDIVLFFHAGWCPKCVESDKNFKASATPDGLTLMKLDFDNSTELRQKYGVTIQHTYVQVDKDGKLIKKWNGSYTYEDLKTQIN